MPKRMLKFTKITKAEGREQIGIVSGVFLTFKTRRRENLGI